MYIHTRRFLVTLFVFSAKWPFRKRSVKENVERGHLRKRTKQWPTNDTQVTRRQPILK